MNKKKITALTMAFVLTAAVLLPVNARAEKIDAPYQGGETRYPYEYLKGVDLSLTDLSDSDPDPSLSQESNPYDGFNIPDYCTFDGLADIRFTPEYSHLKLYYHWSQIGSDSTIEDFIAHWKSVNPNAFDVTVNSIYGTPNHLSDSDNDNTRDVNSKIGVFELPASFKSLDMGHKGADLYGGLSYSDLYSYNITRIKGTDYNKGTTLNSDGYFKKKILFLPESLKEVTYWDPKVKYIVLRGRNCELFTINEASYDSFSNVITEKDSQVYKDCRTQYIPVADGTLPQLDRTSITLPQGSYFPLRMLNTTDPDITFTVSNDNVEITPIDTVLKYAYINSPKSVNPGIMVHLLNAGKTTITAHYRNQTFNCQVNILPWSEKNMEKAVSDEYSVSTLSSDEKLGLAINLYREPKLYKAKYPNMFHDNLYDLPQLYGPTFTGLEDHMIKDVTGYSRDDADKVMENYTPDTYNGLPVRYADATTAYKGISENLTKCIYRYHIFQCVCENILLVSPDDELYPDLSDAVYMVDNNANYTHLK